MKRLFFVKVVICFFVIFVLIGCVVVFFVGRNKTCEFQSAYYYVYIDGTTKRVNASVLSDEVKKRGGAGYINVGERFEVLCFLYSNIKDADSIKEDLVDSGYRAEVSKISVSSLSRRSKNNIRRDRWVSQKMNIFADAFYKIYDLIVDLDTNKISESDAYIVVKKLISSMKQCEKDTQNKLQDIFCIALHQCTDLLNEFVVDTKLDGSVTADLKSLCFEILFSYNDMVDQINIMYK